MIRIAIIAGEASGDTLGAALIRAVRERNAHVSFYGVGGPKMVAEGFESLVPMEWLAVRGYVEVLKSLPKLLGVRRNLAKRFVADKPALFIGIDAPDFNLGLERQLKRAGVPTLHFVSPSIWAWRPERIAAIGEAVSKMLTVFPFEAPLYGKQGIPVAYVGHPLADQIPLSHDRRESKLQLRLPRDSTVIALLPGSRQSEVEAHSALLLDTAFRIHKTLPEARILVPLASRETREQFEMWIYRKHAYDLPITTLFGHASLALAAADVAVIASGTATLEAALWRCPMVITYRVPPLTYRIMKKKAIIPWVGLPNILAGEYVVPELLQDDATPDNLAQVVLNLLDHPETRQAITDRFASMHRALRQGCAQRLADEIVPMLAEA